MHLGCVYFRGMIWKESEWMNLRRFNDELMIDYLSGFEGENEFEGKNEFGSKVYEK